MFKFQSQNTKNLIADTFDRSAPHFYYFLDLTNGPDGHNDFAIVIRYLYQNKIDDFNFTHSFENGTLPFQVDLPRLKIGNVGGSFWSAYTHCPLHNQEFSDSGYGPG